MRIGGGGGQGSEELTEGGDEDGSFESDSEASFGRYLSVDG